jgi:hypothetical protein
MRSQTSPAAYLTITRIAGDPDGLLDAYRRSADVMEGVGRDHGLILHAAAQTGDGLLILNLWPSKDGSEAAARDPRRLGAIREHGLTSEQIRPEHHLVESYVLFD